MPYLRRDQGGTVQLNARQMLAALDSLESASLTSPEWAEVSTALDAVLVLCSSGPLDTPDERRLDEAEVRLRNLAFTNQVRSRLGGSGRPAPVVAPTKQTPALPIAGFVCGGALLVLGWSLGGGIMLAGTAALALFVIGIAVAGTTTVAERRRPPPPDRQRDPTVPPPADVTTRIVAVRGALVGRPTPSDPT